MAAGWTTTTLGRHPPPWALPHAAASRWNCTACRSFLTHHSPAVARGIPNPGASRILGAWKDVSPMPVAPNPATTPTVAPNHARTRTSPTCDRTCGRTCAKICGPTRDPTCGRTTTPAAAENTTVAETRSRTITGVEICTADAATEGPWIHTGVWTIGTEGTPTRGWTCVKNRGWSATRGTTLGRKTTAAGTTTTDAWTAGEETTTPTGTVVEGARWTSGTVRRGTRDDPPSTSVAWKRAEIRT